MASSQLYVAETRQHTNTNKWNKRFGIYLAVTDLAIISIVIFGAQFMRFGAEFQNVRSSPFEWCNGSVFFLG